MNQHPEISILVALGAGFLSFLSPCILPLIPSYLTYITGTSFKELTAAEAKTRVRWTTALHSLFFIFGFSTVFILMGISASYLGQLFIRYQNWITRGGGILVILLGIYFTGIIQLPFLQMEKRFELKKKPLGYIGSFLVGIVFAAGWTPCVGPILSTIVFYASTSKNFVTGVVLLIFYSLGLGVPFFISSLAFNSFLSAFERIKRYMKVITIVSGLFIIGIGVLMLTDTFRMINTYLYFFSNP